MMAPELGPVLERIEATEAAAAVDWHGYRKCPTCRREIGVPCVALSGSIVGGVPDGVVTPLPHAHAARVRRVRR